MSDEELRARLRDLHDAAKSVVIAPGVEFAHRTLRRRRLVRAMMASAAVVILGLVTLKPSQETPFPPDVSTTHSSPSPSPSPSPSESATPSPAAVAPTSPTGRAQAAGVGLHPFLLEYGSGLSTVVGQDAGFSFPIGVMTWGKGTATGVQVIADLSQITGSVDIVGVGSPCSRSGVTVTCDFGTLQINGERKFSALLTLQGKPGAPVGSGGQVTMRLAASSTHPSASASVRIDVWPSVTDLAITSTVPSARIGQTVTVTHTIRNHGPVPEPWATVGASAAQPGTAYVGGEGCTFTATTFDCRVENLAVGETRTVRVTVRVDRCPPRWDNRAGGVYTSSALSDPNRLTAAPRSRSGSKAVRARECGGQRASDSEPQTASRRCRPLRSPGQVYGSSMRRWVVIVLTLAVGAALGGCSANTKDGQATPTTSASPASAASSNATSPSESTLKAMVKAALMPPDALATKFPGTPAMLDNDDETSSPSEYCGRIHPTLPREIHVTTFRSWQGGPVFATESVHGFSKSTAEVLDFVRSTAASCQSTFTFDNGTKHTIVSTVDLGTIPGIDGTFGVCEQIQGSGRDPFFFCTAYLARGHLVAVVSARQTPPSRAGTESMLKVIVRVATAALIGAG